MEINPNLDLPIFDFAPFLAVVTPVPAQTSDTTPDFTFSSSEVGTISYAGGCSSSDTSAVAGDNMITFNALAIGKYSNCSVSVTDSKGQKSTLAVPEFNILFDIIVPVDPLFLPPFLGVVTPVPNPTYDSTPDFTFSSTAAGAVTYEGDCSSSTNAIMSGDTTVTFNAMPVGVHANCKLTVKDANNQMSTLNIPEFEIKSIPVIEDKVAPTLSLKQSVTTPSEDSTPSFIFTSNEAGAVMYEGVCEGNLTEAINGDNLVTYAVLAAGTYNCSVRVKDSSGNISSALVIPTFQVIQTMIPAGELCAGFKDIAADDADCKAFEFVKSTGAMTGHPDGSFDPEGKLLRDQIAKIILMSFKKFDSTADYCKGVNPFKDVTVAEWAFQYVCQAKNVGMVTGYPDGTYKPSQQVNRVEFLALLLRNLSDTMPSNDSTSYSDVATGQWYSGYSKYSKDNNLFTGNYLYPTVSTSRRDVARILFKLSEMDKL